MAQKRSTSNLWFCKNSIKPPRGGGRGRVFLGILGGGVPPGSPNPDPISDQHMSFSTPVFRPGACFSKVPVTFRARKGVLCLAFKLKVSIILKIKQQDYQVTQQNWRACELGTMLLFNRFWLENLPSGPKRYRIFRETGPCSPLKSILAFRPAI